MGNDVPVARPRDNEIMGASLNEAASVVLEVAGALEGRQVVESTMNTLAGSAEFDSPDITLLALSEVELVERKPLRHRIGQSATRQ
jgi:hypothetical protein